MRLHHLEVEAFGPFAQATSVDFDALSGAGLFLLSGATGAGKTSVLDAVCFALYGDVPGDRSAAKRLRCDHAAPDAAPRVSIELTLGERRFRIERSPAWERPKKRGTGMTTQQASVTMSELRGEDWTPLSSRLDETGDLVARLVGMSLTQFTQVAMLPQGRFQTFLRARSDERHQLLQQLFRTGRFAEVERWLRDRRVSLGRADAELHQRVADVVSRVSETTDEALPDGWDVQDLREAADRDAVGPWVQSLLLAAGERVASAITEVDATVRLEQEARRVLDDARAESQRRRRHDAARREQRDLEERAVDHEADHRRLDAARRAAGVVALHEHARSRGAAAAASRRRATTALHAVAAHAGHPGLVDLLGLPDPGAPDELRHLAETAATTVATARAARPRVLRARRCRADLATLAERLQQAESDLLGARADHDRLPAEVARLRATAAEVRAAGELVDVLAGREVLLHDRVVAHADAAGLRSVLAEAREEWVAARETTVSLKEQLVVLQQARIEGMAAELAGALASGCSCPVCGSADHPAKAAAAPGAPDARAEKSLRARVDDASVLEHAFATKVHELEASLAAATARAGDGPPAVVQDDLDAVRRDLAAAREAGQGLDEALTALAAAERAHERLGATIADLAATRARLDAEHDALADEVAGLQRDTDELLADTPHTDLEDLLAAAERTERLCREALTLHEQAGADERALAGAEAAARAAAAEAGFTDAGEAAAAALPPKEVEALADAVEHHRRRVAAVLEVLAEPDAQALCDAPPPPVAALEDAHAAALRRRDAAAAAHHVATGCRDRLTGLSDQLDQLLGPWRELRADLDLTTRLAGFVEGRSADNQLRMRLSAYVVAYRLGQVVAAANERLAGMSDQRYSLEHTGRRGAGETRGGLSLLVRDDWSGETRDPATLSGGETFVVSLALALGLADVVVHESGGATLDTLFVDEGFGSLDADTLDDVMDTLDALRDGGRVVGLVSHVAEMRDRIPAQLVVTKARSGSTVRLRGC